MQALLTLSRTALRSQRKVFAAPQLIRAFSSYPWYQSMAENIPSKKENPRVADDTLDESEVVTRIMAVMHRFNLYDLEKFDWKKAFNAQGVDSLEATALLTSIEEEFHTIFEDRVFENFDNLDQVKQHIVLDHNAF